MKNVWGILMVVSFAVILFSGISIVNNHILSVNPSLNDESISIISKYDSKVENLSNLKSERIDTTVSSNNTNQVEAFFREAAETKNNIEKFRDGIEYIWDLPEILLLSVPALNQQDSEFLLLFKGVVWLMVGALILLVIYKALKGNVSGGD